ncbi:MAG: ATP--guanido phosphotransferase [Clostridium sp.]
MNNMNKDNSFNIIMGSKIKLNRNISGYKFTNKLETSEGKRLSKKVCNILCENIEGLKVTNLWEDNKIQSIYKEKGLITEKLNKHKDFSSFLVNKDENLSVIINEENHIRLQIKSNGNNINEMYNSLNRIDDLLEESLDYSFDESFGYLTPNVKNIGTGFNGSIIIHLPMLTLRDRISKLNKGLKRIGMSIQGVYGEKAKAYGNVYEIYNEITTGISEEEIIENLLTVSENIESEEINIRQEALEKYSEEIEDRVFRSYGILKNARILNWLEAMALISDLRLGAELSLIELNKDRLDEIMVLTRDSVIKEKLGGAVSSRDLRIERAKLVKELL